LRYIKRKRRGEFPHLFPNLRALGLWAVTREGGNKRGETCGSFGKRDRTNWKKTNFTSERVPSSSFPGLYAGKEGGQVQSIEARYQGGGKWKEKTSGRRAKERECGLVASSRREKKSFSEGRNPPEKWRELFQAQQLPSLLWGEGREKDGPRRPRGGGLFFSGTVYATGNEILSDRRKEVPRSAAQEGGENRR